MPLALSRNHRLVYEILTEQRTGTHLTMAQVFEKARDRNSGIGFTTVYRALSRLRDANLVSEIAVPGAESAVYETIGHPHAHFRCNACGCIEDVAFAVSDDVAAQLGGTYGFHIDRVDVSLHGTCKRCRQPGVSR
jgi:Fur family ferric uptake transcriptional regulator